MMFSLTNGMLFELHSVDLAEYSTVSPAAKTITIIGYRPDGSSVSVTGTTDGIIDGGGPLDDFQTFGFQGFTGLSRVEIPSYGWSLDNVRLFVPEPSHTALLILAAAAFRVRRK